MNEREMLELAAKASYGDFAVQMIESGWNPRQDDGDALRLAVKLNLDIQICLEEHVSAAEYLEDPYAATRLAITRAAAEIGLSML